MQQDVKSISVRFTSLFIWFYAVLTVAIFVYLTYLSLRTRQDLITNTLGIPQSLSLSGYKKLFDDHFIRYFLNSVLILIGALAVVVTLSSTVAYGLGRYTFKMKNALRLYFMLGLMFPIQLGIVPIFIMMRSMNLLDTKLSVILILGAGLSLPILLLTEFFAKLPKDLYESSVLDGATEWQAFYRIMFPLASPVVFSICIILSVQIWNQFFVPLLFLTSEANKTIPLLIVKYTGRLVNYLDMAMVSSVMATIPILILFVIFSERILDGVSEGAVKE